METSDWVECRLVDACYSVDYGLTASATSDAVGPHFLRITDIVSGHIDWRTVPYVDTDEASAIKYRLDDGDIVLARTGASTGASCFVKDPPQAVFASYLVRLKARPEFDNRFLAYYLQSAKFWSYIHGVLGDKSAQPNASATTMTLAPFSAPSSKDEQRRIASILGALDDKIELNRRMNRTLEEMAQAIFKSWFIDFDGHDDLVESELGLVPRGWEVSTAGREFVLTMGQSPPGSTYNKEGVGLPFYQGASDFGFRYPARRVFCSEPKRIAEAGDTLVSVRAPVGRVNMAAEKSCLGRGVASLRHRAGYWSYAYYLAHSLGAQFDVFNSEGTVFGSINKEDFASIRVIAPPFDRLHNFTAEAIQIDSRIENGWRESTTLTALRDALLPKLISGEIRVPDAEEILEEAL